MRLEPDTLAVGQREQLVVVHHRVHVFHPQGIYVTVEQNIPAATGGSESWGSEGARWRNLV